MEYLLINSQTGEETPCDKVTIDGFDYYIPSTFLKELNQNLALGNFIYSSLYGLGKIIRDYGGEDSERNRPLIAEFLNSTTQQSYHRSGIWQLGKYQDVSAHNAKKVIATNNPNVDIPKVVDEVEELAQKECVCKTNTCVHVKSYIRGYNKSQEANPFSVKDMIEFNEWYYNVFLDDIIGLNGKEKMDKYQHLKNKGITEEVIQLWKEQKPKIIYYE